MFFLDIVRYLTKTKTIRCNSKEKKLLLLKKKNLRDPFYADDEAPKQGIRSGLETQGKNYRKSISGGGGVSGPEKKADVLQGKIFLKIFAK